MSLQFWCLATVPSPRTFSVPNLTFCRFEIEFTAGLNKALQALNVTAPFTEGDLTQASGAGRLSCAQQSVLGATAPLPLPSNRSRQCMARWMQCGLQLGGLASPAGLCARSCPASGTTI